jgi:hypothetical protein
MELYRAKHDDKIIRRASDSEEVPSADAPTSLIYNQQVSRKD